MLFQSRQYLENKKDKEKDHGDYSVLKSRNDCRQTYE